MTKILTYKNKNFKNVVREKYLVVQQNLRIKEYLRINEYKIPTLPTNLSYIKF
jgi:hypothetical protein